MFSWKSYNEVCNRTMKVASKAEGEVGWAVVGLMPEMMHSVNT